MLCARDERLGLDALNIRDKLGMGWLAAKPLFENFVYRFAHLLSPLMNYGCGLRPSASALQARATCFGMGRATICN